MKKSCYVLEVSAPSGSAHYALSHAYGRLDRLRARMENPDVFGTGEEGADPMIAGLVFHPGSFALYVIQRGRIEKHLDLRTVTRLDFDGHSAKLDDAAAIALLGPQFNAVSFHVDVAYPKPRFVVDWCAIEDWAVPLKTPVLRVGEETDIDVDDGRVSLGADLWLPTADVIAYGAFDLEEGAPIDEVDGED